MAELTKEGEGEAGQGLVPSTLSGTAAHADVIDEMQNQINGLQSSEGACLSAYSLSSEVDLLFLHLPIISFYVHSFSIFPFFHILSFPIFSSPSISFLSLAFLPHFLVTVVLYRHVTYSRLHPYPALSMQTVYDSR